MIENYDLTTECDRTLLARFSETRDQDAFAEIVRRYGAMVRHTARRMMLNEQDAEDVLQAVFFALARDSEKLASSVRIAGWLHEAARKTSLFVLRTRRRRKHKLMSSVKQRTDLKEQQQIDPVRQAERSELEIVVDDELSRLPADLKTAVILSDIQGVTQRKVAEELGVGVATANDRIQKGRELLRKRLAKRGYSMKVLGVVAALAMLRARCAIAESTVNALAERAVMLADGMSASALGVSARVAALTTHTSKAMKPLRFARLLALAILLVVCGGFVAEKLGTENGTIAQEVKFVIPNVAEEVEGTAWAGAFSGHRFQQIFDASQFADLPSGSSITRWTVRPDLNAVDDGDEILIDRLTITLAVTRRAPDDMSTVFDENMSGRRTTVYDGPWTVETNAAGPNDGPREFDMAIVFQEEFPYSPADGNLVFDWVASNGFRGIDQFRDRTEVASSMWSGGDNADSPVSTGEFFGPAPAELTFVLSTSRFDFDENGSVDVCDIDLLLDAIRVGSSDAKFDLNDSGGVDGVDLVHLIGQTFSTWVGDANLDGEFTSGDLVTVFMAGQYEDAVEDNSGWQEGDWNGDGEFTSTDLVSAFQDGGYERGRRNPIAVPEPVELGVILIGLAPFIGRWFFRRS